MSQLRVRLENFPDRKIVFATEFGAVYTSNRAGHFYLIVDESALSELLDEDDIGAVDSLVQVYEFQTEADRQAHLDERGWNRRDRSSSTLPPHEMPNG